MNCDSNGEMEMLQSFDCLPQGAIDCLCGVTDCDNEAVCKGVEDSFPCCNEHCSHDGDGSEACNRKMKIYIAGSCPKKGQELAAKLQALGHTITSSWLWKEFKRTVAYSDAEKQEIAFQDHQDIRKSDCLILISDEEKVSGGKFVEVGIAIGLRLRILVVGRRENMLMWHPLVETYGETNV